MSHHTLVSALQLQALLAQTERPVLLLDLSFDLALDDDKVELSRPSDDLSAFSLDLDEPAPAASDEVDDNVIIVTATKREQTLEEVPVAVSVTSAAAIERAQVRDLKDLQTLVPSLRVSQLQSSANTNFIIRGFGNGANNPGIEGSVGVFIDGVYRSRSASAISDLPNLQRVEVLRGPQSTLFGKNASAGVISIVTAAPSYEFGGSAEISYGNRNAIVAKADITGPISDNIAFSLAGGIKTFDIGSWVSLGITELLSLR